MTATLLAVVAMSCSTRKNTAASRNYQAFITRYNVYYNGDTHYKETLESMERSYDDDFSRLLQLHPANAHADEKATQPQGDFNRSIEKAQKAIQLHSIKKKPARKPGQNNSAEYKAWLKRDEYNPFLHNAWMLMGRSQYMDGDFLGAASTFFYVAKHFTWLPTTVLEAQLWQARSYAALGWLFEAETILTRVKPEQLVDSKSLTHLYAMAYADLDIRSKNYPGAIEHLRQAIATASGSQKYRLNFLLGQIYALEGDRAKAYEAFGRAGKSASAPYSLKFNARIKQSEVFSGADITPEVNALRRMTRYDRNKQYLDQIYYAIGNLYLSKGDTLDAVTNYNLAIEKSQRSGIDKALAQLTLGSIFYNQGYYDKAQPLYAEAVPQLPESYPDYQALKRRSDYLDRLAVYSQNVTLQDSLLKLSYLSLEEQTAVAERLIDELKKRELEAERLARQEELQAQADAQGSNLQSNTSSFTLNSDNSWYFYNPATVTAGKTDFQRRWGSRKLEDDWRRRNKASFSLTTADDEAAGDDTDSASDSPESGSDSESSEIEDADAAKRASDPHFVDYYLKQIPKDDAERAVANDVIQEGLYNMGVILKDDLRDFSAARREFNRLLERYPDNVYRLDVYYNLYLMAAMESDTAMAEHWRRLIVDEFPDSPYGKAMTDPHYLDNLKLMDARQEQLYQQAYDDYLDNNNAAVHRAYDQMQQEFPMSKIMPKFMFIDALAYVTDNATEKFREMLTTMLERYPDTDLAPYASAYLRGLDQGRQLQQGIGNMRGMLWDTRLTNDSTASAIDGQIEFTLDPESAQILVLLYPTDQVSANQLLYDIARINFTSFNSGDFDLEQMNFGRLGMLIIKPFDNLRQLNRYIAVIADNPTVKLPSQVRPVIISQADFDQLLTTGASFDDYFRAVEEQNYRQAQLTVLPPEMFGEPETLSEAAEAEADRQSSQQADPASDDQISGGIQSSAPTSAPAVDTSAGSSTDSATVPAPVAPITPVAPGAPGTPVAPVTPTAPSAPATSVTPNKPAAVTGKTPLPTYLPGSEGDED